MACPDNEPYPERQRNDHTFRDRCAVTGAAAGAILGGVAGGTARNDTYSWDGLGDSFGAGKVEFRAGAGFT